MNVLLWVLAGGAIGAPARYLTDRWVSGLHARDWPWGTFVVNLIGAFALGALVTAPPQSDAFPVVTFLGAGVLGAFTTWSTFSVEVVRLAQEGEKRDALSYLLATLILGVGAAYLGYLVVSS